VAEAQRLLVTDPLIDPEEERHLEGDTVADGLRVLVEHTVEVGEPVKLAVAQPLAEGDRVDDAQAVAVPETLADDEAERQRDVVGLPEGLREKEGVAEEQPLVVCVRVGDVVTLPLPLLLW